MELKIPPPIYMLIFATLMWLCNQYFPFYSWPVNTDISGFVLIGLGGIIDLSSLLKFLFSKTSINPMHPEHASNLVTGGMYRYTRNPMYLGLLFLLTGWACILGSLSALILVPLFILTLTKMQILAEEKILEELFGQTYLDYKQQVRRWL